MAAMVQNPAYLASEGCSSDGMQVDQELHEEVSSNGQQSLAGADGAQ